MDASASSSLLDRTLEHKLKQLEPPPRFSAPPEPQPNTVCFDYEGTRLTHKQVLLAVRATVGQLKDPRVLSVQWVGRNVILGTMWLHNRWLITVGAEATVNVLLFRGLQINGERVKCVRYDSVLKAEYEKFLALPPEKKPRVKKTDQQQQQHTTEVKDDEILTAVAEENATTL